MVVSDSQKLTKENLLCGNLKLKTTNKNVWDAYQGLTLSFKNGGPQDQILAKPTGPTKTVNIYVYVKWKPKAPKLFKSLITPFPH